MRPTSSLTLSAAEARRARLAAPLPSASLTLAALRADEEAQASALGALTLEHLASLQRLARREARRYHTASLSAEELLSAALLRCWSTQPEVLAALAGADRGAAEARLSMILRSVGANEARRRTVSVSAAEAERLAALEAALAADGRSERSDADGARAQSLSVAEERGGAAQRAAEAARFAPMREHALTDDNGTSGGARILRETSLEVLLSSPLRYSGPLLLEERSAGRTSLAALLEATERERFREALRLSAKALEERAEHAPIAQREVLRSLAGALRLSVGARVERYYRQRERASASAALAEEAAAALARFRADAANRGHKREAEALRSASAAASKLAAREADALTLALRLALAERPTLLTLADAATDAPSGNGSEERREAEVSRFDYRSLAEYCAARSVDDTELARWRRTLRALAEEAEALAAYRGTDRGTLERWRTLGNAEERQRLQRQRLSVGAAAAAERRRSEEEEERRRSLAPLGVLSYRRAADGSVRPLSEEEAAPLLAQRAAERTEREERAAQRAAALRAAQRAERFGVFDALAAAALSAVSFYRPGRNYLAGGAAPLSAERFASLSEEEREAEANRWRSLGAQYGSALALTLAEALRERRYLSAEAAALALQSEERRRVLSVRQRPTLAPLTLEAAPLAEVLTLSGASERSTLAEREAAAEEAAALLTLLAEERAEAAEAEAEERRRSERRWRSEEAQRLSAERLAAAERYRQRAERREAEAEALCAALSTDTACWRTLSASDLLEAAEEAEERREARREALSAGAEAPPVPTLALALAALSEEEAAAAEERREALRQRQREAEAARSVGERQRQRLALAADAEALRLALAADRRREEPRRWRSADRATDAALFASLRRLAGAEAERGAEALAERRSVR